MSLQYIDIAPPDQHTASIIWLHGLGASGDDFAGIPAELRLGKHHGIRFLFPHAPAQAVSMNQGYVMPSWYDIFAISVGAEQDEQGIRDMQVLVDELIHQQIQAGIPSNRIVLAGFSQGGAMALHCGLRFEEPLAGILALSTYLPISHTVEDEIHAANRHIPIFWAHGSEDTVVPMEMANKSTEFLQHLDIAVDYRLYPMQHSLCSREIIEIKQTIQTWLA